MSFGVLSRLRKMGKTAFHLEPAGYNKTAVSTTVPKDSSGKNVINVCLKV
jgi:hypothetical protein